MAAGKLAKPKSKMPLARLLPLLCLCLCFCGKEQRQATEDEIETLGAEELALLREGDFVFRMGYGVVSLFLEIQGGSSGVSHVGVLSNDSAAEGFSVIHSISGSMAEIDGVQKTTLDNFLYEAKPGSFVATRLKNSNKDLITREAQRLLAKQVPFNLSFDIKDTTRLFCSQMVNYILQTTHNTEVFSQEAKEFPFSGFFDTTMFDIVVDKRPPAP